MVMEIQSGMKVTGVSNYFAGMYQLEITTDGQYDEDEILFAVQEIKTLKFHITKLPFVDYHGLNVSDAEWDTGAEEVDENVWHISFQLNK